MLTRSVIARRRLSTALQAQVYRSPTRQLHVTLPRAQIQQPQGPGFYIQLKFWRPGTPRSRIMGAFVGLSLLFNVFLLSSLTWTRTTDPAIPVWAKTCLLLLLEKEYDGLDLDDPVATLGFFQRIILACLGDPGCLGVSDYHKDVEIFFKIFLQALRDTGATDLEKRVHDVLRGSVEKIHHIVVEINPESFAQSYEEVTNVVISTFKNVKGVNHNPEDKAQSKPSLDTTWNQSKQDAEAATKSYDSLG